MSNSLAEKIFDQDSKWNSFIRSIERLMNTPNLWKKVQFFRMISICLKAWLWIRETLISIAYSEKHVWLKNIIRDIIDNLNQWNPLYKWMSRHDYFFWSENIELIRSSEIMWNLPDVLNEIADEQENFQKITSKIKSSMMYPSMVLLMAIWAVIVLLVKVMPNIVSLFPNQDSLPWITKFMLWASSYLQSSWWIIILTIIIFVIWFTLAKKKIPIFSKFIDLFLLKFPLIKNISRKFYHYRFCKLLSDFSKAWVWTVISLEEIKNIFKNFYYKDKIIKIKSDLELWFSFTEALEWTWLFDDIIVQIISIWEKTWSIWEVLQRMAIFYREELDNLLEWLMKLLEPILMWFIAIIVWVIVASIFLPMAAIIWTIWEW